MSEKSASEQYTALHLPNITDDEKKQDLIVDSEKEGADARGRTQLVDDDEILARDSGVKPAFIAKVRSNFIAFLVLKYITHLFLQVAVLNRAIAECGMGRYQVCF